MRVIAGKFRQKRLASPESKRVRPTSDRIKETMFNILYSKNCVEGILVLDLFGGSGALGIEALSRGAASCVFCDIDRESIRYIRENLKIVGAESEVYHADCDTALAKLRGRKFDLILVDPPYNSGREQSVVDKIVRYELLNAGGIVVIEHAATNMLDNMLDNSVADFAVDTRVCGNTKLTFLTKPTVG